MFDISPMLNQPFSTFATVKNTMTYEEAINILGYSTNRSLEENARKAKTFLASCLPSTPLRYKVAADILIKAAK